MIEITVLGAGAFGTALAIALCRPDHEVVLAARRDEQAAAMRTSRENTAYLPGVKLPADLQLDSDWNRAIARARIIVMAVPSRFARAALAPFASSIRRGTALVSVTKGIELDTLMTMSQMLAELAPQTRKIAVLSGPGFAAEVARGKPAALIAAARDEVLAREIQHVFASPTIRPYRSTDVLGVELGGVVKNVIAIAAGVSDGLEFGSSARAALITRGIAEMMRLTEAAGANSATIAGLAGIGDLVLTCSGDLSRNRRTGLAIARGEWSGAPESIAAGAPVAEGVFNAASVRALAHKLGVEMPIVSAVYRMLYEKAPVRAIVEELFGRELKAEFN